MPTSGHCVSSDATTGVVTVRMASARAEVRTMRAVHACRPMRAVKDPTMRPKIGDSKRPAWPGPLTLPIRGPVARTDTINGPSRATAGPSFRSPSALGDEQLQVIYTQWIRPICYRWECLGMVRRLDIVVATLAIPTCPQTSLSIQKEGDPWFRNHF